MEWVKVIGNLRLTEVDPLSAYKKYFICSDHFEDDAIKNPSAKVKRLKGGTNPTKFDNDPISNEIMEELKVFIAQWKGW